MNTSDQIVIRASTLRTVLVAGIAVIVVLLLIYGATLLRDRLEISGLFARGAGDQIDRNTYQAVFLVGGQVYFGKLATRGDDYFVLADVYYLPASDAASGSPAPQRGQLIKRGTEIHGPQDAMVIPASNLLFFENLRADGDVMVAIRRFKSGEQPPATLAPSTPRPASPQPSPTR